MQHGYSVFHGFDEVQTLDGGLKRGLVTDWQDMDAWKQVLDNTIFRPNDFAKMLDMVLDKHERLSWVGWDDINIHFPRSMYSTNRKIWEKFSQNWEGFRANLSIFECTAPRKDKVVSFILGDMNWDILVSGRQKIETTRWFWDKDFYEPERVNKFRLDIDKENTDYTHVPSSVWEQYWARKMALINESTEGFREMLKDIDGMPRSAKAASNMGTDFSCAQCGRIFGNAYNLNVHLQTHKNDRISVTPP